GLNYISTKIGDAGGYALFENIVDIPPGIETNYFYWNITFVNPEGAVYKNTSSYNQTISSIIFAICNSSHNVSALNFTVKHEINETGLNASFKATFYYWQGEGVVKKNYTYQDVSVTNSSFDFCIFPVDSIFNIDADIEYERNNYGSRTYYLRNAVISNVTNLIDLYLLGSELYVKFFITVKEGVNPFQNAIVTISKYFVGEGVYKAIGTRISDEYGEFVEYLDLDKSYKFSIVKDGTSYGTIEKQATCTEAPCELILQITEAIIDV
ncbi:unnamed protein product, partial [marine sediment metagenome]